MDYHGLLNLEFINLIRRRLPAPGLVGLVHLYYLYNGSLILFPVPFQIPTSQVLFLLVSRDHIVSLDALPTLGYMNTLDKVVQNMYQWDDVKISCFFHSLIKHSNYLTIMM